MGCIHYEIIHLFSYGTTQRRHKRRRGHRILHALEPVRCCSHARTSDGRNVITTEAQATYTILSNRIVFIPVADTDASRPGYRPLEHMRGLEVNSFAVRTIAMRAGLSIELSEIRGARADVTKNKTIFPSMF